MIACFIWIYFNYLSNNIWDVSSFWITNSYRLRAGRVNLMKDAGIDDGGSVDG
jgi:hypothetical protein